MDAPRAPHCHALIVQISGLSDEAEIERVISAHTENCRECALDEQHLSELIVRYRATNPAPLPAAVEGRILDMLCRDQSG